MSRFESCACDHVKIFAIGPFANHLRLSPPLLPRFASVTPFFPWSIGKGQ